MICLMIMALLATLIVPGMANAMRRTGVEDTGKKLADLLRFSSVYAMTRHRMVILNMDSGSRRCWVTTYGGSLPWQESDVSQPKSGSGPQLASLQLPANVMLTMDRHAASAFETADNVAWETVTFRANGGAEDVTIHLAGPKGETFDIDVYGVTGELRTRQETAHE